MKGDVYPYCDSRCNDNGMLENYNETRTLITFLKDTIINMKVRFVREQKNDRMLSMNLVLNATSAVSGVVISARPLQRIEWATGGVRTPPEGQTISGKLHEKH